ncbi:MAG: hypothetical protein QXM16_00305 [Nitrososphaerota archaeon]
MRRVCGWMLETRRKRMRFPETIHDDHRVEGWGPPPLSEQLRQPRRC